MKKVLAITIITVLCLASCKTQKTNTLYSWDNYSITSYNYLKNSDKKATQDLMKTYQSIINKQTGTRKTVPPGVYADYGFLLLQADKIEEGKEMLEKEIALYPESIMFITRILKMIEQ